MGDEGFLADLDVKLRAPDVFGDVTRCYGTVTGVDTETGRVSIDLESTNHLGDITATGSATVVLPTN
jgi:hypothetical protein